MISGWKRRCIILRRFKSVSRSFDISIARKIARRAPGYHECKIILTAHSRDTRAKPFETMRT